MNNNSNTPAGTVEAVIDLFFAAFTERDTTTRNNLLERAVVREVSHWSRKGMVGSRTELSAAIGVYQSTYEDLTLQLVGEVQTFRDVARAAWELYAPDEQRYQKGESYFEFGDDGRLKEIVEFSDPPHNRPFGGGPQVYVDAWNSDTDQERSAVLADDWADNGRWVELNFDKTGPDEVGDKMVNVIHLEPVGGLMDVIELKGFGAQIRFQVKVTKRTGETIGTFSDFIALDAEGRVKRLAGFKGPSLVPARIESLTDPAWKWSYAAGYLDSAGQYAGGSEIMHLAGHKGKLYAANGYWEDSHWVVPSGAPKQSAQVLRLDSSDGSWEVDLDTGQESPPELNFMKGNILRSVTFTKDGDGNVLETPEELLVMSAGNIYSHICVWVRDDDSGQWIHEVVMGGKRQPVVKDKPGIVRWVPRDMEIYTDKVTGQEIIFLLAGNPGILSGVYDPGAPSKIRWDSEVEFPREGFLDVRPLGMVEANGELYFSGGGTIYKRLDGPDPSYSELLTLEDELNVEMGGIRGLSAIDNPHGDGQSLIFMWGPNRESVGQIKRLDPDGKGGYTVHDEVEVRSLMNNALGKEVVQGNVLGAYNNFYPFIDPATGQDLHLIGFQCRVSGDPPYIWQRGYYPGGMYAIRFADGQYKLGEINGTYVPGKPPLTGPRTFALSPFGDQRIFAAGNDTNFIVSTDMAWVFSASLEVWLSSLKDNS